jgi:anti-sigma B factor antagonist
MKLLRVHKTPVEKGVWALSLHGSVDASTIEEVVSAANEVLDAGARHVLLDLGNTDYVSSAGFSAFLRIADQAAEKDGKIVFLSTPSRVREVFKILGLENELSFAPDAQAALVLLRSLAVDDGRNARGAH